MKNDPLLSARRASSIELAKSLYKIPTLLTTYTRCGKSHCRCNGGELHGPYFALYWREGSAQRRRYVRPDEVSQVRSVLARRRTEHALTRLVVANDLALLRRLDQMRRDFESALDFGGTDR